MHVRQSIRTESFANIRCRLFSPITTLSQIPKQDSDRPHTPPPVCNSLHHKVTGLRLTASATDHGLAAWLHHQVGWLFQCYTGTPAHDPLCAYMTSSIKPEVHNVSQSRQSRTEPRTWATHTHTHTHTRLTALFLGLPGSAGSRKVKPIWILLKQETVSGSGISWAICKSAPVSYTHLTLPTKRIV